MTRTSTSPRVAVAGATGLIGRALLQALRADPGVGKVYAVLRSGSSSGNLPAGVKALKLDYAALAAAASGTSASAGNALPPLEWAICALGTTIKQAGSEAAFRAVDVDAVLAFARAAKAAGAKRFGVISALGANAKSKVFYNRCKGEMEAALAEIGFEQLIVARPSLLLGDRNALGQPTRLGEGIARHLTPFVAWAVPRKLRPIQADTVARAMLRATAERRPGARVIESDELQSLGVDLPAS